MRRSLFKLTTALAGTLAGLVAAAGVASAHDSGVAGDQYAAQGLIAMIVFGSIAIAGMLLLAWFRWRNPDDPTRPEERLLEIEDEATVYTYVAHREQ